MTMRCKFATAVLLLLTFGPLHAWAQDVDEAPIGEAVERHLSLDEPITLWVQDADRVDEELGDQIEVRETLADTLETIKLSNLVPPIQFETGLADIPDTTVESLAEILERMKDRRNVRLHLVGHADNRPLSPRLAEIYTDNAGLSRERAGQVAEHFQTSLALPADAISYSWAGDAVPVASNDTDEGRSLNRRVEVEVWYDELAQKADLQEFLVPHEIQRVKVCRMETVCKLRYVDGHAKRARIQNLVAPLRFDAEAIDVDDVFIESVRQAFDNLKTRENVVVRFIGYSDDSPLSGRAERIYGDQENLSKARARRVALAVQDSLELPSSVIESDGRGAVRALASNATPQGRALNRRVEVEFWYDDPLQDLPDEPQLCPEDAGAEVVTRVYDPPWGDIEPIDFADGSPVVPAGFAATLERALADVADKTNARLRFIGYTRNERLERRTADVYGDDIGLSTSRARRAMETVLADMGEDVQQAEFEGHGYVHSDDVVNAGFVQGETSHVAVQVIYDELAILDDYEGVDVTRLTRELEPTNPLGLNLMRITVDGKPIDDPKRSSADIQRCTDVALAKVDIKFGYDNLSSAPRLSVAAQPSSTTVVREIQPLRSIFYDRYRLPDEERASPVFFRMYTNYSSFIDRAEVRVFEPGRSPEAEPLDIVPIDLEGTAKWIPPVAALSGSREHHSYVLRAYNKDGNFDETQPQPLWVIYDQARSIDVEEFEQSWADINPELLQAYGEDRLSVHNIGLSSGTVNVRGSGIPDGHEVWVAGRPIPVDETGSFVSEEILPEGSHTVEVAVLDQDGGGELYLRDLEFEQNDWFYVGMANLTLAQNSINGPAELLQAENGDDDLESDLDGRLAFFVNGKFGEHWKLTASADTREGPLDEMFSNFMEKSPDALFRRIDPDYYYPTYGDDSTVQEMAPSMGKFYVRMANGDDYGQWGNFKVGYMNNELAQVDRGLYGANLHYESDAATLFGERKLAADVFAAEPGTVGSREEFRGTGGSLYYLQRQDVLAGSERLRIELRDKASGMVTGVMNLVPSMDYDIDYLQGRILLSEPLSSTVDDNLLVRSNAISGDEAYLVVRYEYTPGFEDINAMATGGQLHYWFGDYVKLGVTSNINEADDTDSTMNAADVTFRWSAGSWLKLQQAESEGLVALPIMSNDGGFGFTGYDPASFVDAKAGASRADISVNLGDFFEFTNTQLNLYVQEVEAGYSAPGLAALSDTENVGGSLTMPLGDAFSVRAKADSIVQDLGVELNTQEYNFSYQFNDNWNMSAGYRRDERTDSSVIVPLTQEQGVRADAVVQLGYNSRSTWDGYLFMQDTLSVTGDRKENSRAGAGGSYRLSEKLRIEGEVSDGDLGVGGRIGTTYMHSEQTSMYVNYALENERTDNAMRSLRGQGGNLVAGVKSRLSDSTSVYLEERYQHSDTMTGLTHATGINFAPASGWSFGLNTDIGTLQDINTGSQTDRMAMGVQMGFGSTALQFSSAIEYRDDDVEQLDLGRNQRETWLFKNSFKYQVNDGGRLLGKFNHSDSTSSLGAFFDGGFTEAVFGYAYRPVSNDRLNALVKYTYFYNMPTTQQLGSQNIASDFLQKSHIAAVDVAYDITQNFTIGGKYAYRLGQVSLDRDNPQFFENNANLYVIRGDYRFRDNWEALLEARLLDMPDLNESRSGALATLSRYFGKHVKVGVGYNFTDFSDDLTDLSYDHSGAFLSVTGTL
ncbi:MAG: OmpA family protein [Woeseiaceae bacterium]